VAGSPHASFELMLGMIFASSGPIVQQCHAHSSSLSNSATIAGGFANLDDADHLVAGSGPCA
jgi:hypothetical protein